VGSRHKLDDFLVIFNTGNRLDSASYIDTVRPQPTDGIRDIAGV
jgi:hypothetical protein